MEKKISVALAGQSFTIEEEAYSALQAIITSYQEQLLATEQPNVEEAISYLEQLMADHLNQKATYGMTVVTSDIIEQLRLDLPSPEALTETPAATDEEPADSTADEQQAPPNAPPHEPRNPKEPRRLYRDTQHRIIGGVAAGLAYTLGVDVTIIRIILIVLGFVAMPIVAAYLITWLLLTPMPDDVRNEYADQWKYTTRICRLPAKGKIGGVAAGLADTLNCDALWIRLAWIVLAFPWLLFITPLVGFLPWMGGLLVPVYFILWIILPAKYEESSEQRPNGPQSHQTGAQEFAAQAQAHRHAKAEQPQPEAQHTHANAKEFAPNANNYRPANPTPRSNWFTHSAGCAMGGCGCLLLFFAVPILIGISIFFPTMNFWLDPIMMHSPEEFFQFLFHTVPPHLVWIISLACGCFLLIPLLTICYSIISKLLDLPPIPAFARAVLCLLWAFAIIALMYMVAHYYFGFNIFSGSVGAGGLAV